MSPHRLSSPRSTAALAFAVWCLGAFVFFRVPLWSGFDMTFGNNADGRLIVYLHEHLYQWLRGNAELLSPKFFHPQPNTFGYSDAGLLNALPYSVFRFVGLDSFVSLQLWVIAGSLLCFASSVVIALRYLRVRLAIALLAAILITFPNNLYFKSVHPIYFSIYYIPALVLLFLRGFEDFPRLTGRLIAHMAAFALLYALLFSTSFYSAWLFALTVLIAGVTVSCMAPRPILDWAQTNRRPLAIVLGVLALTFAIGLIPMALIYMPMLATFTGRSYRDYTSYAPFPIDFFNISTLNLMWGWLVQRVIGDVRYEAALAVTPVLMLTVLWRARMALRRGAPPMFTDWERCFIGAVAAVAIVSWLLTTRIGTASAYWFIYHLLPGASAIRVGGRIQLYVNLWVVAGFALMIDRWWTASAGKRSTRIAIAGIAAICLLEQINRQYDHLPRRQELARLASVPTPPPACRSFLVAVTGNANANDQNDAMWISNKTGLPTINGSSGWLPPGWQLELHSVSYETAARAWIARNNLTGVCIYDRATKTWSPFP